MTERLIVFDVLGLPIAQGSFVAFIDKRTHRAKCKPDNETTLAKWRARVAQAADGAMHYHDPIPAGGVDVQVVFAFTRPTHHYRTGRFDQLLRDDAPRFPDNRGSKDVDKLIRAVFDALTTAQVWGDDSQVCDVRARKRWAGESEHAPATPGVRIQVKPAVITEGILL